MANEKLSELYKVNDIELKEVVKPDSVTFENGRYRFESLDNYFASKSGSKNLRSLSAIKLQKLRLRQILQKHNIKKQLQKT